MNSLHVKRSSGYKKGFKHACSVLLLHSSSAPKRTQRCTWHHSLETTEVDDSLHTQMWGHQRTAETDALPEDERYFSFQLAPAKAAVMTR